MSAIPDGVSHPEASLRARKQTAHIPRPRSRSLGTASVSHNARRACCDVRLRRTRGPVNTRAVTRRNGRVAEARSAPRDTQQPREAVRREKTIRLTESGPVAGQERTETAAPQDQQSRARCISMSKRTRDSGSESFVVRSLSPPARPRRHSARRLAPAATSSRQATHQPLPEQ